MSTVSSTVSSTVIDESFFASGSFFFIFVCYPVGRHPIKELRAKTQRRYHVLSCWVGINKNAPLSTPRVVCGRNGNLPSPSQLGGRVYQDLSTSSKLLTENLPGLRSIKKNVGNWRRNAHSHEPQEGELRAVNKTKLSEEGPRKTGKVVVVETAGETDRGKNYDHA